MHHLHRGRPGMGEVDSAQLKAETSLGEQRVVSRGKRQPSPAERFAGKSLGGLSRLAAADRVRSRGRGQKICRRFFCHLAHNQFVGEGEDEGTGALRAPTTDVFGINRLAVAAGVSPALLAKGCTAERARRPPPLLREADTLCSSGSTCLSSRPKWRDLAPSGAIPCLYPAHP